MAKNKHPEDTVARILDVAMRLFVERGYEQTTMQNIIDELGGLTKGAVYHHFSSKEEVFLAAMDRVTAPGVERLRGIRDAEGMTGARRSRRCSTTVHAEWTRPSSPKPTPSSIP